MSRSARADLLIVVRVADERLAAEVERHGRQLLAALGPLGLPEPERRWWEEAGVLTLAVGADTQGRLENGVVSWGRASPFVTAEQLLEADDVALRSLPTPCCAFACDGRTARVAGSSGSLQTLYAAAGDGVSVWSTHAVAAACAAAGRAEVDPALVAELAACEFVGGADTLFRGVTAMDPGTVVEIDARGARTRSYSPASERFEQVPEAEASAHAERAFLVGLEEATRDAVAPVLGATAGLDSLTVAAGLAELGAGFKLFTFNPWTWEHDVSGAQRVAKRLGLEHSEGRIAFWRDEEGGLERLRAEALWRDGCAEAHYGEIVWPHPLDPWIVGIGAETARAYYWRWSGARRERASRSIVAGLLRLRFEQGLAGGEADRLRGLRRRWAAWCREGFELGYGGFRTLDFVYANQRVRHWARSQMPRNGAGYVPAFAGADVTRAMIGLPFPDRLRDGWERRFVTERLPDLEPPAPDLAPPGPYRRVLSGSVTLAARHARRRMRAGRSARPDMAWDEAAFWRERGAAAYVEWLADEVLAAPLVEDAVGARFARLQRARLRGGDPRGFAFARLVGSPVAAQQALRLAGLGGAHWPTGARN